MGKAQKKTGKGRLDKYYKLAKEQGYRARSAFKLIQLNKKYNFLESAKCTIDLCAAPGGWLQVASKYMPVNSVIVGVDLVPIKPIPRVVTFACDITTPQCRTLLRGELKDWKADVVLHDGAPNVGTAWVQDAFTQSELVLMSLKLAAEFLVKGGTFVTKVFRSADYNNLIWVFNQLFQRVEATKPPSSRNVSAEIFVVCRDFLAPRHIDPKFFDSKEVFKDLSSSLPTVDGDGVETIAAISARAQVNVFQPEKNRRHRGGYDEGDYTLFKQGTATNFVKSTDPIAFLGTVNKIAFETDEEKEWLQLDLTTDEIKSNCEDLKVLGKGDFKALMKWRVALREEVGLDLKTKEAEELTEAVEITEDIDPEQEIEEELERLNSEAASRAKRERRRANEVKQRTIQRMQLQMTAPLDIGLEMQDLALGHGQEDVFDLEHAERELKRKGGLATLADVGEDGSDEEDAEGDDDDEDEEVLDEEEERARKVEELEAELDGLYDAYQERMKERDAKYKVNEERRKNKEREEWGGIRKTSDDEGSDGEGSDDEEGGWDKMQEAKAHVGSESESDSDDDSDEDEAPPVKKRRRDDGAVPVRKKARLAQVDESAGSAKLSRNAQVWFGQDLFSGAGLSDVEDDEEESEVEDEEEDEVPASGSEMSEGDDDDFEIVPQEQDGDASMWDVDDENEDELKQEKIRKHGLTTVEAMTIAQQLVNHEKTRTELMNDGFNRYSLNHKDGLPTWFLDDESKHYKPNVPVTKEAVAAIRAKLRALDARPIKKIAEAKARKKYKAAQRLEKAMKKAEGVNDASDMTEREKAKQIEKLMKKGTSTKAKKEIQVVVAKGANRGLKGRPKGVKGRYVMVDPRMRKELRAKKRKEKASKKRKRT